MARSYHLDPYGIPLSRVSEEISRRALSPKRKILADNLEERFARLGDLGISSLGDLIDACKTKTKMSELARHTGFPEDYLVVLRREAMGYLPKPVDLGRVPDVPPEVVDRLRAAGLGDSKRLWEYVGSGGEAQKARIDHRQLSDLRDMADLCRIPGVGPVFARMIFEAGYRNTTDLSQADVDELSRRLDEVNEGNRYTGIKATKTDVAHCIRWADELRADT